MEQEVVLPLIFLAAVAVFVRYRWRGTSKESQTLIVPYKPEHATSHTVSYLAEEGYLIDRE